MRILLLGERGQLGYELCSVLDCFGDVVAPPRGEVDVNDADALFRVLVSTRPQVVVNATAYTDVDGAEREPAVADHVNHRVVGLLGEEAKRLGFGLIHFSTDFVFDGEKSTPYVENDKASPLSQYGRTKLDGEKALTALDAPAVVFRTSWVYSLRRKSYVTTMLRLAREREVLKVVTDQVGSPTFCRDLAQAVGLLLYGMRSAPLEHVRDARGIYHLAGAGSVSRFAFTQAIVELDPKKQEHKLTTLEPILTKDFPLPARRPLATPLDCHKTRERFGIALPNWRDSLARALASA